METKPKLTHGGRRDGSGRPRLDTVPKIYKLDPESIRRIKLIAKAQNRTESSVVNEFLYKATMTRQERIEAAHAQFRLSGVRDFSAMSLNPYSNHFAVIAKTSWNFA
jgi:hypothetical protein